MKLMTINAALLTALLWIAINAPSLAEPTTMVSTTGSRPVLEQTSESVGKVQRPVGNHQPNTGRLGRENVRGESSRNPNSEKWGAERDEAKVDYDLSTQKAQDVDCPCGPDCKCPSKLVCEHGDCKKNYIVFFTATWCGPCKRMYPVIDRLRSQGYIIYMFDVDQFPEAAKKFNAVSVPTMVVMDKGKEVTRFIGVTSEDELKAQIRTRKEQDAERNDTDYNFQ
jgi:thioredoxin 1